MAGSVGANGGGAAGERFEGGEGILPVSSGLSDLPPACFVVSSTSTPSPSSFFDEAVSVARKGSAGRVVVKRGEKLSSDRQLRLSEDVTARTHSLRLLVLRLSEGDCAGDVSRGEERDEEEASSLAERAGRFQSL